MFIFNRPLVAVAAGIGTALLVVLADGLWQRAPSSGDAPPPAAVARGAVHTAVTCAAAEACGMVRAGS